MNMFSACVQWEHTHRWHCVCVWDAHVQDGAHVAGRQVVLFGLPVQVDVQSSQFILAGLAGLHCDHRLPHHPTTWEETDTSGVRHLAPPPSRYLQTCPQVNSTKLYVKQDPMCSRVCVSPDTGVLSSSCLSTVELPVCDFLSSLKTTVSPSVLADLDSRGQMSSSAGRRLAICWNTDQSQKHRDTYGHYEAATWEATTTCRH